MAPRWQVRVAGALGAFWAGLLAVAFLIDDERRYPAVAFALSFTAFYVAILLLARKLVRSRWVAMWVAGLALFSSIAWGSPLGLLLFGPPGLLLGWRAIRGLVAPPPRSAAE